MNMRIVVAATAVCVGSTGIAAADDVETAAGNATTAQGGANTLRLAQATPAANTRAVEEVVVTAKRKFRPETSAAASKLELPIIETPQALTVLSSEFLNIARLT